MADRDVFIGELGVVCEKIPSTVFPGMRERRPGADEEGPCAREELEWEWPTEAGADGGGRGSAGPENELGTAGEPKPSFV